MTVLWIVVVWPVVAAAVGLAIGHVIYLRDRQVPRHHDARTGEPGRHHERTRT